MRVVVCRGVWWCVAAAPAAAGAGAAGATVAGRNTAGPTIHLGRPGGKEREETEETPSNWVGR